ncbi:cytochrome P450 [Sistotremastrum niveocremeum HHB9708]|uniref:Cytochrome P450 n=1 Tax=Sistotremastrum niveocremeum HHB9708 TaxID=1314777 RepID=A0A164SN21_9AGAM|nr:cytochrome P450 [Sistotremastrum niveocremeum HHB9708]
MLGLVLLAIFALYVARRIYIVGRAYKLVGHIPGFFTLIEPSSPIGGTFPPSWWNLGLGFAWHQKAYLYKQFNSEVIRVIPILYGDANLYTCSADAMRQIKGTNSDWYKPAKAMQAIDVMGPNVVASEGEDWRRQRRIAAPAFNQRAYQLVWQETERTYRQMIKDEGWAIEKSVMVFDMSPHLRKIALFVISACGFGFPLNWSEPAITPEGKMSPREVITQVSINILLRHAIPPWLYHVSPSEKLKTIDTAYKTFDSLLHSMIDKRADEIRKLIGEGGGALEEKIQDIFGRLVLAQVQAGSKLSLNDQEIVGNAFIMMFAGHETTAHTLGATLAELALHEEEQEKIHKHIKKVIPEDREPIFEDYDNLEPVLAAFFEALRLFPAAYQTLRKAARDTTLPAGNMKRPGEMENIPVKEGSSIFLDLVGVCYNERNYPEPEKYMPSRWYSATDRFLAFSYGPRTCLGIKFANTEAVCFLTNLLREWKVEPLLQAGETKEQWKERVLSKPTLLVTMTLEDIPLKLVRRR